MSTIDYLKIEILPSTFYGSHGGTEKLYRVEVQCNEEKFTIEQTTLAPSYMTETEFMLRMARKIEQELREKAESTQEESK